MFSVTSRTHGRIGLDGWWGEGRGWWVEGGLMVGYGKGAAERNGAKPDRRCGARFIRLVNSTSNTYTRSFI